jgi:hypothetical protein
VKRWLVAALVLLSASRAAAHKPSDSYLTLRPDAAGLAVRWDIALRDLEQAIGLDGDGDGAITWGEVRARQAAIGSYALAHLQLDAGGAPCRSGPIVTRIDHHADGAYAVLELAVDCGAAPQSLRLQYTLFFDFDPQHRGIVRVSDASAGRTWVFSADRTTQSIALAGPGGWRRALQHCASGVRAVGGSAAVPLLLLLLGPLLLGRRAGGATGARRRMIGTAQVGVACVLGHCLMLSLIVLDGFRVAPRLAECGVAALLLAAAINAVYPLLVDSRWTLGFLFGLAHGVTMAGAFAALSVVPQERLAALIGFDLGLAGGHVLLIGGVLAASRVTRRICGVRGDRLFAPSARVRGAVGWAGRGMAVASAPRRLSR